PIQAPLPGRGQSDITAEFSPDGRRLLAAGDGPEAKLFDLTKEGQAPLVLKHGKEVKQAAFSADGCRVLTIDADGTVQGWDAVPGQPVTPPLVHYSPGTLAHFSPDRASLLTVANHHTNFGMGTAAPTIRLWELPLGPTVPSRRSEVPPTR